MSPIMMDLSVPCPLPVLANEPNNSASIFTTPSKLPLSFFITVNKSFAAFHGPIACELDGPIPILKISKTLIFSMNYFFWSLNNEMDDNKTTVNKIIDELVWP